MSFNSKFIKKVLKGNFPVKTRQPNFITINLDAIRIEVKSIEFQNSLKWGKRVSLEVQYVVKEEVIGKKDCVIFLREGDTLNLYSPGYTIPMDIDIK